MLKSLSAAPKRFLTCPQSRNQSSHNLHPKVRNTCPLGEVTSVEEEKHAQLGVKLSKHYLRTPSGYISPWHDLSVDASDNDVNTVTGVVKTPKGSKKINVCDKKAPHNPIMQAVCIDDACGLEVCSYEKPIDFNYGLIPQTWTDSKWGGHGDPLSIVDLSSKIAKPILSICDYRVLGVVGLVNRGKLDYKIIAMELNEARERKIETLQQLRNAEPARLDKVVEWFSTQSDIENRASKLLWKGEVKDENVAAGLVEEHHRQYQMLREMPGISEEFQYWMPNLSFYNN